MSPRAVSSERRWYDPAEAPLHPIESYGMIGNNRTALLVSPLGSMDWGAFPRFDSAPTFGALLDRQRGGRFAIDLAGGNLRHGASYLSRTNVLVTRLENRAGEIAIEDFCPEVDSNQVLMSEVHRRVRCVRGSPTVALTFAPRFDFGRVVPEFRRDSHGVLATSRAGSVSLSFSCDGAFELGRDHLRGRFQLSAGEDRWFVVGPGAEVVTPIAAFRSPLRRAQTLAYWRAWSGRSRYHGRWRPSVERSALALKLLFYRPTGAMVAAPTTSLPEEMGGSRNWDYRFTWIRDTTLAVRSLFHLGYADEATDFVYWLLSLLEQEEPHLKVLYTVDGTAPPAERILPDVAGYRGSRPVRVGNAAHLQAQHDRYGDVLSVADLLDQHGGVISVDLWRLLRHLVERAAAVWSTPDHGIWEVRGRPRHYVYSKVMAWVALDRGIDLGERLGFVAPYDQWREIREEIRTDVLERGTTSKGGGLAWYYGARSPDASLLRLPSQGFLSANDPLMERTVAGIERELVDEPFVARYRLPDGLAGTEGYFLPCAFWRVEYYVDHGDLRRARELFTELLRRAGPLGLFAEEIDRRGQHLGNYPLAFTHLALVLAATHLNRALGGVAAGPLDASFRRGFFGRTARRYAPPKGTRGSERRPRT